MGIPEPTLNKVAKIVELAINIKNLRKARKIVSEADDALGGAPKKPVTSRKNNSPKAAAGATTERAVH
jgi:hypothetical protein